MLPIDAANGGGAHNALARPKLKEAAKRSRGQAARLRGPRKEEQMNCTRRTFVRGAAASGVVAALAGFATACSPAGGAGSNEEGRASAEGMVELRNPTRRQRRMWWLWGWNIRACRDSVCLESGAKVITLEASDRRRGERPGNRRRVRLRVVFAKREGHRVLAQGHRGQRAGVLQLSGGRVALEDLVSASAGNIEWLMEQGVEFGDVDNYHGQGQVDGFHWFASEPGAATSPPWWAESNRLEGTFASTHAPVRC